MTDPTAECERPLPLRTVSMALTSGLGCTALFSSATPPRCSTFARPQSTTCTSPKEPTMTFEGFRSRCTTLRACA